VYQVSIAASRKHERLSSMAQALREPMRALAPCLKGAVAQK
jgi:hypothetical protein